MDFSSRPGATPDRPQEEDQGGRRLALGLVPVDGARRDRYRGQSRLLELVTSP
jgi:hypothetical protein